MAEAVSKLIRPEFRPASPARGAPSRACQAAWHRGFRQISRHGDCETWPPEFRNSLDRIPPKADRSMRRRSISAADDGIRPIAVVRNSRSNIFYWVPFALADKPASRARFERGQAREVERFEQERSRAVAKRQLE